MFPRNENRNEGTFAKTTLLETALLSPSDPFWGCAKGWFPKGWFRRMFPRNENRNEGTFAKTTLLRNRPFISQWVCSGVPKENCGKVPEKMSEQLPCRSAEVTFFSVFLCQRCREIWREIGGWQRVGAQKGGFENALFNLKNPWKIPENTLIFESINFQAIFMAPLPRKMPEKCLKLGNASLFTKFLFTIFAPLKPPPSQPAKWGIFSWISIKRTSNRIANTQPKLRTNPPKIANKQNYEQTGVS